MPTSPRCEASVPTRNQWDSNGRKTVIRNLKTTGTWIGTMSVKGFKDEGVTGPIDETEGAAPGKDVTTVYKGSAQVGIWWE